MDALAMFFMEMGLCLLVSGIVVAVLTEPLRRLLLEACATRERAAFWVAYSDAMIFIAPLVTTVVFGKSGSFAVSTFAIVKAALGSSLFGVFVALAAIGLQVARVVPRPGPADECGGR